jgi:hypothetical protein
MSNIASQSAWAGARHGQQHAAKPGHAIRKQTSFLARMMPRARSSLILSFAITQIGLRGKEKQQISQTAI